MQAREGSQVKSNRVTLARRADTLFAGCSGAGRARQNQIPLLPILPDSSSNKIFNNSQQ